MDRGNAIKISAMYGFLGCALVLVATSRYGIGLSADSVTYLAAAQNIIDGRGYVNFDGAPVLAFPPLFSTLIAVLSVGLFDLASIARFMNAFCFGLIVFLSAQWFFRHLRSSVLALLGTTSVLFSAALLGISVYAWSEPLFVVLTMSMLLQLERVGFTKSNVPWVLAGIFASLAVLDRYAGIIVVMTGAILLAAKGMSSFASTVKRLFLFVSIAALPIGLWFYRNYQISSTLTGYRVDAARTFTRSAYDMISVLSLWFLPGSLPFLYRASLLILSMILFLWIVFGVFRVRVAVVDIIEILPFLLFASIYTVFMVYTTSTTALSPIDNRYMSPIFTALILSLYYLLDRWMYTYSLKAPDTFPRAILATCLAIWLIYPIVVTYRSVKANLEEGAGGFHTAYWAESELISYLTSNELPGTIYTNEPSAVYVLTGKVSKQSPEKFAYESQVPTDDLSRFQADLQRQGYLIWFHTHWWEGWLYDIDDLQKVCDIETIVTRQDGDVYKVQCGLSLPIQ